MVITEQNYHFVVIHLVYNNLHINIWKLRLIYLSLADSANPCDPNPCGQGLCSLQDGFAVCQCHSGFSGENCSTRK